MVFLVVTQLSTFSLSDMSGRWHIRTQSTSMTIVAGRQTTVKAGLRPPPSAADGLDSGLPPSPRWPPSVRWPGMSGCSDNQADIGEKLRIRTSADTFFPLSSSSSAGGSKHLRYPPISSRGVPPVRPERHVPHSIASIRRELTVRLVKTLPRCPCCLQQQPQPVNEKMTQ